MKFAYRVALICGGFPLLFGISIFLLWLITRWEVLIFAGISTIFVGLAFFLIGAIALARFCRIAFRSPDRPRRRIWLSTLRLRGPAPLQLPRGAWNQPRGRFHHDAIRP